MNLKKARLRAHVNEPEESKAAHELQGEGCRNF
jgi:hypothetical protein